jgi:hypothetical protein
VKIVTRRLLATLAAALTLSVPTARADLQDAAPTGQIGVTGTGKMTILPTTGVFSITVTTYASKAAARPCGRESTHCRKGRSGSISSASVAALSAMLTLAGKRQTAHRV